MTTQTRRITCRNTWVLPLMVSILSLLQMQAGYAQSEEAALAFIQQHEPPVFKEHHALLPLANYGPLPFELNKRLADQWGYALHALIYSPGNIHRLRENPDSDNDLARLVRLAQQNPGRYQIQASIRPATVLRRGWPARGNLIHPE